MMGFLQRFPGSKNLTLFWGFSLLGLCFGWVSLFSRTSLWWNEASYYTHGWSVPFLALLLYARGQVKETHLSPINKGGALVLIGAFICFAIARSIGEPDPFWRFPLWAEMASLSVLTALFLHISPLQKSWKDWIPCGIYLLTCLPWPAGIETSTIHTLTGWITHWTAETLLWLGQPAEMSGRAILVDQKIVSIDQACSGIRSFQNLLSFGLFFGFYFYLSFTGILLNLFIALLISIFFNFIRAIALSWLFLEYGKEFQLTWHDFVGNITIVSSLVFLWFSSSILSRIRNRAIDSQPRKNSRQSSPKFIARAMQTFGISILGLEILIFAWFDFKSQDHKKFSWKVELGERQVDIQEGVRKVLLFDYGGQAKIDWSEGRKADVIHFGYDEESAAASLCSRNHPPDFCMGYSGLKMIEEDPEVTYQFYGDKMRFRHYKTSADLRDQSSNLHLFWGSFSVDSRIDSFEFKDSSFGEKAKWFLSGKLSFERQVLLIGMRGAKSQREARKGLYEVLSKIIHFQAPSAT